MFERPRDARLSFVFTIRHGRRRFVLLLESVRVRRRFVQRRSRGIVSEILRKRESESAHAAQRSARVSLVEQNAKTERLRVALFRKSRLRTFFRALRSHRVSFPFPLEYNHHHREGFASFMYLQSALRNRVIRGQSVFLFPLSFPLSFITNSLRARLNNKER